jgi:hypothetical protein
MRLVRLGLLGALVAGTMAITAGAAQATARSQANGQGQTPLSASLGFNAQADLSGNLNYNADPNGPNAGFSVHCNDYTSFKLTHDKDDPEVPEVKVRASNCFDQDGNQIYLRAKFWDYGEPGTNDELCIIWSYNPNPKVGNAYIVDQGVISNGNIQIHVH